jgi:acyl dehydratase
MVAELGASYLDHSTPAVRWFCRWFTEPKVGDRIRSITRVKDKYERKGRRFLEWEVEAHNQKGELVVRFGYVNMWDRGRPEDRDR